MHKKFTLTILLVMAAIGCFATPQFISFNKSATGYPIIQNQKVAALVVMNNEDEAVKIAARTLSDDFERVCGNKAPLTHRFDSAAAQGQTILIGTATNLSKAGALPDTLCKELNGRWEKYIITSLIWKGKQTLIITGSDRRGTIYGIYELSKQMGISPWFWWADVPTPKRSYVAVKNGIFTQGEPAVQYRGIFINDEWPCYGRWANEKFGGFNSRMYKHLFELVLRLKGNYVWPAMWSSAFFDDDPNNGVLANKMGIVMGTSHHEPMQLNQQDWKRKGRGAWNYVTNKDGLEQFWRYGIARAKHWEKIVTIGMRGDGDKPMDGDGNMELMERIIQDQRQIITDVTGKPTEQTPQVWALYKEVMDYYDKGMKVPDDVTLLLCDDNWGNMRFLPSLNAKPRKGGYGLYYHFDYVGAPRCSKWMNVSNTPRVWEQLRLSYDHKVNKLWIVNVGDLKLQEYPTQFFMDLAWNPEAINAEDIQQHSDDFYTSFFGTEHGKEIGSIMARLGKTNRSVTPENLTANTFSFNYEEWPRMVSLWNDMEQRVLTIRKNISPKALDAYDQLVCIPVKACANLYRMYYAQAMNKRMAKLADSSTNAWADEVERCFVQDSLITNCYHKLNNGKWNHFMDQTHIGYSSWNAPAYNICPKTIRINKKASQLAIYPQLKPLQEIRKDSYTFIEKDKCISIEAAHTTRRTNGKKTQWLEIPDFGKTLSGMTTWPQNQVPESNMSLEYDIHCKKQGNAHVVLMFAPTLNYNHYKGLRYAVSLNGKPERTVNINQHYRGELGQWQKNPIIESRTIMQVQPGLNTLSIRLLDPGMVLEKIVINRGGVRESYFGPSETLAD